TTDPNHSLAVGRSLSRVDGFAKVTGQARYTGDLHLPETLIGRCLRSPYPSARIISINATKARRLHGVHTVLTGSDVPEIRYGRACLGVPILARDVVRFVGEKVAAVAADTSEIAEEALSLIDVQYEELPAVFDVMEALSDAAPRVHDGSAKIVTAVSFGVHG